jgi:putative tryptophan/tyrosine transport system substrate-binding protein
MKRREFITLIGGAAGLSLLWPLATHAQQPAMPVIGFLSGRGLHDSVRSLEAFQNGLSEAGFIERKNVAIEYRWADGDYNRLPAMASDLVHRQVAVIVAATESAARAAKSATVTIPIVFTTGSDPIAIGLVPNLNRPTGNVTGATLMAGALPTKQLELLHELVPTVTAIGMLVNPSDSNAESSVRTVLEAARALGMQVHVLRASTPRDIDIAFTTINRLGLRGIFVTTDAFFLTQRDQITLLAARNTVPATYNQREFVEVGGLLSYGASTSYMYRQVGAYAARILHGAKPTDLPIVQPTKFELVINLRSAKALDIEVPPTLLARADEVIE